MVHLAKNGTSGHVCPDTWPEVMCLSNWGLAGSIWGSEMSVQVCIDTSQFADVEVIAESSVQWSQVLDGNLHWFHRYTIKEHQDYWNQCNNRTYDNRCYRVVLDCSSLKSRWLLAVTEVYVLHWHVNVSTNRHRAYGVVGLSRSLSTALFARGVRFNSGYVHIIFSLIETHSTIVSSNILNVSLQRPQFRIFYLPLLYAGRQLAMITSSLRHLHHSLLEVKLRPYSPALHSSKVRVRRLSYPVLKVHPYATISAFSSRSILELGHLYWPISMKAHCHLTYCTSCIWTSPFPESEASSASAARRSVEIFCRMTLVDSRRSRSGA